ncbi:MAG: hypothetical protein QOE97_438 [Pseudonocardiales bacterium]|jgi:hypothetical protein|nr:hypothetical protein [Pseudonocardiales bacterium]
MTTLTNLNSTTAVRRAAVRATRAPSIHNTQPWELVIDGNTIELRADPTRRLPVLDPHGRQLLLSCGCALFNARAALAAAGRAVTIARLPDRSDPNVLARIVVHEAGEGTIEQDIARLDPAIDVRRTNRRQFASDHVPAGLVQAFLAQGRAEGAEVGSVERPEDRVAVAVLAQRADAIENADPAYRAELRAWTSDDPGRDDGVPAFAVPHVDGAAHDDVPIRDFDARGTGGLPSATHSSLEQALLLIGSLEDSRLAWLRTGEALERVLLEIATHGYTAGFLTQAIEVTQTNVLLRQELRLRMHPHVLLRVGLAEATPPTRRRRLVDVLSDS